MPGDDDIVTRLRDRAIPVVWIFPDTGFFTIPRARRHGSPRLSAKHTPNATGKGRSASPSLRASAAPFWLFVLLHGVAVMLAGATALVALRSKADVADRKWVEQGPRGQCPCVKHPCTASTCGNSRAATGRPA